MNLKLDILPEGNVESSVRTEDWRGDAAAEIILLILLILLMSS